MADLDKALQSTALQTATSILQLRKQAEKEIREANEALERRTEELGYALAVVGAILDSTTDAVIATDAQGSVTHCNAKCEEIWKIHRHEVLSRKIQEVWRLTAHHLKNAEDFLSRTELIDVSAGRTFDFLELADGRFLEWYSAALLVNEKVEGRVWSFRDISERHRADLNSRRLAAIVDSSDDAIVGKDLNSIVTSWNAGAQRIFGYSPDEMIGSSILKLIPPERHSEEDHILGQIRSGKRVDHYETIRVRKGGGRLYVSLTVSPIKDASGKVIGVSKIARDITERKETEQALKEAKDAAEQANQERLQLLESERAARGEAERASRMKDEFLATLSHELRTPLNAVVGWANLLRSGGLEEGELEHGLEVIQRNAHAQTQIINDLLDMSRIISGKVRLDVQPLDLSSILHDCVESVSVAAQAKGVQLQRILGSCSGPIYGDASRIQQVFWNLLTNAIKFTPKGGRIQILLDQADSKARVKIIDSGEGISAEFLPCLFDRFQQADASITRRHGGLGLGLAIVKQLVELHGGSVAAFSGGAGQGSTFTVYFPMNAVHPRPEVESKTRALAPQPSVPDVSLHNVNVLVVDDEPDARHLVKRLLEMAGATVSMAGSGNEAMEQIATQKPDILVCDIGMPGEDGYTFIQRLRSIGTQDRRLPAIALTAYARSEDRIRAIRSGFQNHLTKPVEPAELLAVIRSLVDPD